MSTRRCPTVLWILALSTLVALMTVACRVFPSQAPVSATATATASPTPRPPTATPTTIPAPPTPTPPSAGSVASLLGVSTRGETSDPQVRRLMTQAGVRWVRTSVNWDAVQPAPGVFDWVALDGAMITMANMGVIPVVYVAGNPAWAASSRCGPIDRVALSEFAHFVSVLVKRYDGTTVVNRQTLPLVTYWQFYNEPDNLWTSGVASEFDGCWGQAGAQYAQMLATVWTAVHEANPQAQVVFGGIAAEDVTCPTTWECAGQPIFNFAIAGQDFVDDALTYMESHPDSRYFDIFDLHYYPTMHTRWDDYGAGLLGKVEYYRQRLAQFGITRPFMCSESGRRSDAGQKVDGIAGSDEEQSRYLVRLFAQGTHLELVNVLWFTLADFVEPKEGGAAGWGLLTQDLQPKLSYTAYTTLNRELAGLRYQGQTEVADEQALEGYDFVVAGRRTTVLWARSGAPTHSFQAPLGNAPLGQAGQVTVVSLYGEETVVRDGDGGDADGKADGVVTIAVSAQPVYVRRQP